MTLKANRWTMHERLWFVDMPLETILWIHLYIVKCGQFMYDLSIDLP